MDWHQLAEIVTKPDNIPIVIMLFIVPFYTWYGWRQGRANDRLIDELERNPEKAKTHHRKTEPYKKGWPKVVEVWPYLLKMEFLAAVIVTAVLIAWSVGFDAPLEEPANPNLTMNPSKAPWYFLGLQEMLVYFDPWIAGVVLPTLIIFGLIAIPYCDTNPRGNGYYTIKQRKYSIGIFFFGFHIMWLVLIFIGVFVRGPGWIWFWPGETWDHHRVVNEAYQHLPNIFGIYGMVGTTLFGLVVLGLFGAATSGAVHYFYTKHKSDTYASMNLWQYATMHVFLVMMVALPVKMVLWHGFRIKYVMITPWFNI